ncbi:MAG: hypothetical protein ACRDH7_02385 [Actinomycetota bacterium]
MDVRPSENDPSPLRPGDILLFHGHGPLSWAIRRFEESDVDHAAIVLGPETMAEVTPSGLRYVAIAPALEDNAFTYVRRPARDVDVSPIVREALSSASAGETSLHDRVVLLAVLGLTRRLPIGEPTLRTLLWVLLHSAADVVDRLAAGGRTLLMDAEFVYRCYQRSDDPEATLKIPFPAISRPASSAVSPVAGAADEAMLWEWAAGRGQPWRSMAESPELPESLERLIVSFGRVDSPHDPIVLRSEAPEPASVEPFDAISDDDLHAAAVRFRDRFISLALAPDPPTERAMAHPWATFRAVTNFVTPGDLRYSPSLDTVMSLRPSSAKQGTASSSG